MSQLQEYRTQRELLRERISTSFAAIHSKELPPQERRELTRKLHIYEEMLADINEQIMALDPNDGVSKNKKPQKQVISLNRRVSTGAELGELLTVQHVAEDDLDEELAAKRETMLRGAAALAPRQAEAMELRYNRGYSYTKIAEEMGISKSAVDKTLRAARRVLREWAELGTAVNACIRPDGSFDYLDLLRRAPWAFTPQQHEIIRLLCEHELASNRELARLAGSHPKCICLSLARLKRYYGLYGIPEDAWHPLVRRSRAQYEEKRLKVKIHTFGSISNFKTRRPRAHDRTQEDKGSREYSDG